MTSLKIEPLSIPLREDEPGVFRIGRSRVSLETVITAFQGGLKPEGIVEAFDCLELAEVYAVLAYYLAHREEVDHYLAGVERRAEDLRLRIERDQRPGPGLTELLRRESRKEPRRAQAGQ